MYFSILETTVRPYLHTSQHYHELNYLFFFVIVVLVQHRLYDS